MGEFTVPVHEDPPRPAVSILIPSHRSEFLGDALQSIYDQTVPASTYQVLVNFAPDWYANKINDIARIARGKYLCILCDDDKLAPNYLEKCLDAARGNYDIIYTDIQFFGERTDGYDLPSFGLNTFRHASCPWMTALVKKSLWDEVGGQRPGIVLQDTAFWIDCAKLGANAAHVRERLLFARQHANQGAKLIDKSAAALQMRALYPDIFPGPFDSPLGPDSPRDGRGIVAPVFLPPRLREATGA